MSTLPLKRSLILALLLVVTNSGPQAQQAGELITIQEPVAEDLYLAGRGIHVLSEINADLVAAAWRIVVEKTVSGDLIAAAEQVMVRGDVGDDARLAGRTITIAGQVGDDAIAAGETISLIPEATVGGRFWVAGRTMEIAGTVTKELRAAGQTVTISGVVQGDAFLVAETIEILPGARLDGDLFYRSPNEAFIAAEAVIAGSVQRQELEMPERPEFPVIPVLVGLTLSLLLCASIVYWLFPRLTHHASGAVKRDPFKCLGLGLTVVLVMPVLAIVLMITVLGIPLGLVVVALYPVALLIGFLLGLYVLSNGLLMLLRKGTEVSTGWRFIALVLAIIVLLLTQLIPFVGGLALLFLFLFGLGALALHLYRHYADQQFQSHSVPGVTA